VLIDESSEMATPIAGGTKSKSEGVATAVNSLLNQLTAGPDVQVAIVAYGGDETPGARVRWAGPLAERSLVSSTELAEAPVTVEDRVRRIPGVGGAGIAREETIRFPVWYVPQTLGAGDFGEAVEFVVRMLADQGGDGSGKPPLVLHVCGEMPAVAELVAGSIHTALRSAIWCHLHLGSSDRIPAGLYPSSAQRLASEQAEALFEASCIMPESMIGALRAAQVAVGPGARGLAYQATMGDLIRFLALAKAYASAGSGAVSPVGLPQPTVGSDLAAPPAAVVSEPSTDRAQPFSVSEAYQRVALIVLADRSEADAASGVWLRRQEQINDLLGRIAKRAGGDTEVALIAYGGDSVDAGFRGPLEGRTLVPDVDLADGAIRMEEVVEKVSNGIGGLVELRRSRPILMQCDPSGLVQDLEPAVAALSEVVLQVQDPQVLPLILHVTGGDYSAEMIASAGAKLAELGDLVVYHSIVPEMPKPTLAYPASADPIQDPSIAALWQITSPLAGAEQIATRRRTVTSDSRGLVVGAKFDLLTESLDTILNPEP
jgi:hypothetical protein